MRKADPGILKHRAGLGTLQAQSQPWPSPAYKMHHVPAGRVRCLKCLTSEVPAQNTAKQC